MATNGKLTVLLPPTREGMTSGWTRERWQSSSVTRIRGVDCLMRSLSEHSERMSAVAGASTPERDRVLTLLFVFGKAQLDRSSGAFGYGEPRNLTFETFRANA